jgi:quinol monooxygenase YgiN
MWTTRRGTRTRNGPKARDRAGSARHTASGRAGSGSAISEDVVQLLLRITAVPGHTDNLLQALRSVMRNVQVDGGCSDAHLLADVDDRNVLWYWEDWTGLDVFERHLRSERFARLLSIVETSSTLPLLECRLVAETRGLDYLAAVRGVELPDGASQAQD